MSFKVDEPVLDEEGFRGIVRYIGCVATSKKKDAVWVGVEWEDSTRGKHDGEVTDKVTGEKHRYFKCKPGHGSFAKPKTLKSGRAFNESLIDRYEPDDRCDSQQVDGDSGPRRKNGTVVSIEAVGMNQIRNKQKIGKLREVSLQSSGVSSAGPNGWIKENCPLIKELDLSDNLIDSWVTAGRIANQLEELEHLSLARNKLVAGLPSSPLISLPIELKTRPYTSLKVLVLNRTGTSFSQMQRLEQEGVFPFLEQLVLGDNNIESLDPIADLKSDKVTHQVGSYAAWAKEQIKMVDRSGFTPESFAKGFKHLHTIDISRNKISNWSEVWRLSRLPALRKLNASDNPIEEIFFDTIDPVKQSEVIELVKEKENDGSLQAERLKAAEEFKTKVETGEISKDSQQSRDYTKPPRAELDIVMSNGMVIPMSESREKAKYTDARLFKGDGTDGGSLSFSTLESLLLCRTRVNSWKSVDALNNFPSLKDLRLQESPVISLATNLGAARQTIIARVRGLTRLNGSEVGFRERSDAERLYLKRIGLKIASGDVLREHVSTDHPRFDDLVKNHGDPMETAKREKEEQAGGSLASNSAKVTIKSFDPKSCTVPPATKRLPLSMTVKELKVLCQRLFKVDADLQKLFYRETGKSFGHPVALDEDIMPIVDYGVKAGGEIIMEARDPEKEKEDAVKKSSKEAQLMKEQEERAKLESDIKRKEVEHAKTVLSK
mmetsp:Transcript_9641/g.15807  ORF Transcript_9641/g.15807 Transcript_9641/m.15807 type:complete len:718 (-) Transcript_9641:28-2181(-)|eukprot:CAMPEP_0203746178 /NCGR_PEP_ID=MMETSP0098-20131031/1692_1 /ASSEMBLY_ACC=CAM_ASM_000208 /TAXON_ID=96639 /ORGANISM=" , Strain NY0313808BC1" /LENGTH=717 /DNA_ID=CAMNT_0050634177 /DNA_START=217 /DNA_END=2370 /DNA_ORIENTATION=-